MNSEAPQCELCALRHDCPKSLLERPSVRAEPGQEARGRSWRKGALLVRQGQRPASFLFVKCGLLLLRQLGPDGVERSIGVVGRGHLLGLQGFYGLPAGLSLRAVGPVAVCDIPFARLRLAPALAAQELLMRYNHRALGALARWGLIMRMPKLGQRMAAALLLLAEGQAPGLVELPNQSQMAELLGVTRESINRAYRVFEGLGALRRPARGAAELDLAHLRCLLKRPPQELA
jgi:CRP-like cAMP-binding protein